MIRHFTSIVFEIVRPNDRLDQIRAITDKYFVQDACIDDLVKPKSFATLQYIWPVK